MTLRCRIALALLAAFSVLGAALLLGAPLDASSLFSAVAFALAFKPRWWVLGLVAFVMAVYVVLLLLWPLLPDT